MILGVTMIALVFILGSEMKVDNKSQISTHEIKLEREK